MTALVCILFETEQLDLMFGYNGFTIAKHKIVLTLFNFQRRKRSASVKLYQYIQSKELQN